MQKNKRSLEILDQSFDLELDYLVWNLTGFDI